MNYPRKPISLGDGAGGRNRTDTLSPEQDFESSASTSSATPAYRRREFPRALHLCCTWRNFAPSRRSQSYSSNPRKTNAFSTRHDESSQSRQEHFERGSMTYPISSRQYATIR